MTILFAIVRFSAIYVRDVFRGGLRIAWDVFTPGLPISPRIIDLEVPPMKPFQRLMLASLISMTPGSISIDYNDRGDVLHIHLLYSALAANRLLQTVRDHYVPLILSFSPQTEP